ncbi:MAG: hypothetical protein ACYDGN_12915 [Acidimicrobiales bacterium]
MTKVTMEIPAARASQMAQFFLDEGFEVSWDGPLEKRAGGIERELVQTVFWLKDNTASGLVGGAAYAAAQSAVRRIRERFPSVKAEVQDDAES